MPDLNAYQRAIQGAGGGAIAGSSFGPYGIIAGAILGGAYGIFGQRSNDSAGALRIQDSTIRSATGPRQWLAGECRLGGQLAYITADRIRRGDMVRLEGADREARYSGAVLRAAIVLSEGQISSLPGIYADGTQLALHEDDYPGAAHGRVYWLDTDHINARLPVILQEILTNTPNDLWKTGPQARALYAELEMLRASNRLAADLGGSQFRSVLNVYTDMGQDSQSAADRRLRDTIGTMGQRTTEPLPDTYWDGGTEQLEGLSWALVELYSFTQGPDFRNRMPQFTFRARSGLLNGGYTENPAEIINWVLTQQMGLPASDIVGLAQAQARSGQSIILNAVQRGTQDAGNPFTLDDLLAVLFPGGVPTDTDQIDAALTDWNGKYAGADNAENRYQFHGIITSEMLAQPENLLRELGEAMAGWVAVTGNSYHLYAGEATAPSVTLTETDLAGIPEWLTSVPINQRVNVVSAALVQDKEADWTPGGLTPVEDATRQAADGYREKSLGTIPGQTTQITARRVMTIQLRRSADNLLKGTLVLGPGPGHRNFGLVAGQRVRCDFDTEDIDSTFVIMEVSKSFDNQLVSLSVREDPDVIYSDGPEMVPTPTDMPGTPPVTPRPVIQVAAGHRVLYDSAEGTTFQVGLVQRPALWIRGIRALGGGTLVYRAGSGAWTVVDSSADLITDNPVAGFDVYFIRLALSQPATIITFASRTGAGTDADPYVYNDPTPFSVSSDPRPEDFNRIETRDPNDTDGGVEGELWITVSTE